MWQFNIQQKYMDLNFANDSNSLIFSPFQKNQHRNFTAFLGWAKAAQDTPVADY